LTELVLLKMVRAKMPFTLTHAWGVANQALTLL
jgi:hypothetical protein